MQQKIAKVQETLNRFKLGELSELSTLLIIDSHVNEVPSINEQAIEWFNKIKELQDI